MEFEFCRNLLVSYAIFPWWFAFPWSFPDACKIAKTKPVFKTGLKTDPSNYRHIYVRPFLSKVFKRVVLDQTKEFLSLNKIL